MPGAVLGTGGATTDKEVVGLLRRRTMTTWYEAAVGGAAIGGNDFLPGAWRAANGVQETCWVFLSNEKG